MRAMARPTMRARMVSVPSKVSMASRSATCLTKAVEAMSEFGGAVLKTSLSKDVEEELLEALHGGSGGSSS